MTTDRPDPVSGEEDDETFGVLDESATLDEVAIDILGDSVEQVSVVLPEIDDDLDNDDDVVDDEVVILPDDDEFDDSAKAPTLVTEGIGVIRESDDTVGIVIEIPADEMEAPTVEDSTVATAADDTVAPDLLGTADIEAGDGPPAVHVAVTDEILDETITGAVASPIDSHVDGASVAEVASEPEPEALPGADEGPDAGMGGGTPVPGDVPRAPSTGFGIRALREYRAHEEGTPPSPEPTEENDEAPIVDVTTPDVDSVTEDAQPAEPEQQETASEPPTEETRTMTGSDPLPRPREVSPVRAEDALTSKRLDDLGERDREGADQLTADRLLDSHQKTKRAPEGTWPHLLYTLTGHLVNIGDSKAVRQRKDLTARISAALPNGTQFVPVLSRKGGVGKTTVTALLGMALADAREDRVVAVDANPDRGTLADRVERPSSRTVRDLVRIHDQVQGFADISSIVSRDATRLDVLASDSDPHVSEAFGDDDYRKVAAVAARYYSLVLTDTGTGIVHSVMDATLDTADQIVIVAGLSVDQARLASETLTWLETNGHRDLARSAVVVLNHGVPGASPVRVDELEAHFASRARSVIRIPYDADLAAGSTVHFAELREETRNAARELAAAVVDGLRVGAAR